MLLSGKKLQGLVHSGLINVTQMTRVHMRRKQVQPEEQQILHLFQLPTGKVSEDGARPALARQSQISTVLGQKVTETSCS